MQHSRTRWIRGLGAVVLVGGFLITSVVTANDDQGKNPFTQILHKLDQILGKVGGTVDLCHGGNFVGRFVVNGSEVCDRTTGLTWEQQPNSAATTLTNAQAVAYCQNKGNHYRLPEDKELISLIDIMDSSVAPDGLLLPAGHPFIGVQPGVNWYWSATRYLGDPTAWWGVRFRPGIVNAPTVDTTPGDAWCVRGA